MECYWYHVFVGDNGKLLVIDKKSLNSHANEFSVMKVYIKIILMENIIFCMLVTIESCVYNQP